MSRSLFALAFVLFTASPAWAGNLSGLVTDATGAPLASAAISVRAVATGQVWTADTGADGRYRVPSLAPGTYFVTVRLQGFRDVVRQVVIDRTGQEIDVPIQLADLELNVELNVTAARAERDTREVPLHVETLDRRTIAETNPLSSGDAFAPVANVTPVGGGPFGVRPRLRGLDSTRVLVLVDGERLNTARLATDRTGAEVGLVSPDSISRLEIVNGAGTLMYGSDALAGTINIITNEPGFSPSRRFLYGLDGFYSTNENGARGTLTLGVTSPRYAVRVQGGKEQFDNYHAGRFGSEDTNPFFASGAVRRADTIDDNFGFAFRAFPDPFNAPYVRSDREILNSQARGNFVNASALVRLHDRQTLRLRFQRRRMQDIGFPDFKQPYFFNATSLPHSRFDRASASYEVHDVTPWLANVSVSAYYQGTERLLVNQMPVQFPAPSPAFLPINVMRLDIRSETEQRVWTPGASFQATLVPSSTHLVTAGVSFYRDSSSDRRTTTTATSMVGQVVAGARGPAAVVFPSPVPLGAPAVAHPVRVPAAHLRDVGVFVQDEWRLADRLSLVAGLRGDFYDVATDATPGYDVASVVAGATPAIDPATLPAAAGENYSRRSLTGDVGLVANRAGRLSPFVRIGRSYRHPNLEEMLFAGPATVGSIAPNVGVRPETGVNVDFGANWRAGRLSGGAYAYVNRYEDFIVQDVVVATTPSRAPLAQTMNYADVTLKGIEVSARAPMRWQHGTITFSAAGAFARGDVRSGSAASLVAPHGGPADNVTPSKAVAAVRYTEPAGRWWAEYGVRVQGDVTRVSPALLESPFLIAQDLLALDGFAVHRLGAGIDLGRGRHAVRFTAAVENLTDNFYREHFQFAPARGRSVTAGFSIGAF